MRILALDLATKTGWAITPELSGVESFALRKGESTGMQLIRFKKFIFNLLESTKIDLVVYERVAGFHVNAVIFAAKLASQLESTVTELGIDLTAISAKEIKMYATGKGNASKEKMEAAAKYKFPHIEIIDDNHADALLLLDLAIFKFSTTGNTSIKKKKFKLKVKK